MLRAKANLDRFFLIFVRQALIYAKATIKF